jgi:hypothetical protein
MGARRGGIRERREAIGRRRELSGERRELSQGPPGVEPGPPGVEPRAPGVERDRVDACQRSPKASPSFTHIRSAHRSGRGSPGRSADRLRPQQQTRTTRASGRLGPLTPPRRPAPLPFAQKHRAGSADGVCSAGKCALPPHSDGVKNDNETGIDCGCDNCNLCPDDFECETGNNCQSLVCWAGKCLAPKCDDGRKNGDETGIDCGGSCNAACP